MRVNRPQASPVPVRDGEDWAIGALPPILRSADVFVEQLEPVDVQSCLAKLDVPRLRLGIQDPIGGVTEDDDGAVLDAGAPGGEPL